MRIGSWPRAQIVWEPTINHGLVRFLDLRSDATEQDHDHRTDAIIARIAATGEALFGGTTWRGKRCMRVSVCNWQTSEADVDRAVQAAQHVLGNLAPTGGKTMSLEGLSDQLGGSHCCPSIDPVLLQ